MARENAAGHTVPDTAVGTVLINGGFSPDKAFNFDPATLTGTRVGHTAENRFCSTTLTLADSTAVTLYGPSVKNLERSTQGVGWATAHGLRGVHEPPPVRSVDQPAA